MKKIEAQKRKNVGMALAGVVALLIGWMLVRTYSNNRPTINYISEGASCSANDAKQKCYKRYKIVYKDGKKYFQPYKVDCYYECPQNNVYNDGTQIQASPKEKKNSSGLQME